MELDKKQPIATDLPPGTGAVHSPILAGRTPRRRIPLTVLVVAAILAGAAAFVAFRQFVYAPAVAVVPVRVGTVHDLVTSEGTVQTRVTVNVSSKITGVIVHLFADQGDLVQQGQLLATLESSDLASQLTAARAALAAADNNVEAARQAEAQAHAGAAGAQQNVAVADAQLNKARADLALSQSNVTRNAKLFAQGYVAASQMDSYTAALQDAKAALGVADATLGAVRQALLSAEAAAGNAAATVSMRISERNGAAASVGVAQAALSYTRIVAPMNGLIVQRSLEAGSTVVPGSPIFVMAGPTDVWAAANVDETVVGKVRVGQPAHIRLRTGVKAMGKVVRITHQADAVTRELEVDVKFMPVPKHFTLNEEVAVSIGAAHAHGLVIPSSALVAGATTPSVFIVRNGRATLATVQTGLSGGGQTLVLAGAAAGDMIVTHPQGIKSGERVHPIAATTLEHHGPGA
jgi:HlyD family secretion protein